MAATCAGILVSPGEVGQLAETLNDVAGKWELFLSQLKVPEGKRDQIKLQRANHPNHAQLCLLDGLEYWVACDDSPTYEKIISALRSEVVNNPAAALKIKEMHLTKDSKEEEDQEISDFPLSITVTPEDLLHIFKEGKTHEKTDGILALLKATDRPIKTITDEDDKTLLHLACHNNWVQWLSIAKTLVDVYSCNPSAQDRYGNTPLHDACKYDNQNLAKYFLSLESCDLNIKNAAMESALYIARESPDMVRILLASGLIENDVVDEVFRFMTMSDVDDPLSSKNDVKKLLEDYTRCVQKYDTPTMPFPHKTCCVLLDLLERNLLHSKTKCRMEDIVAFSSENGLPLPSDSKSICELLSEIGEHKLYKFNQKSPPESSVLEKRPPGYRLEEDHEVASQDFVISLLQPEVDATEHSSLRMQCTEMETLQHTASGSVYETVQSEHHQAAGGLPVPSLQKSIQESLDKNAVADSTGNTTSSCSPAPEQNDGIDNEIDSATLPDNTEPLVEQQPNEPSDSDESSFDEPTDTVPLLSDGDTGYIHGGDFELDDAASMRSHRFCRQILELYCRCHLKLYQCMKKDIYKRAANGVGVVSLFLFVIFILAFFLSSYYFRDTGSFYAIPGHPIPAKYEGFDAFYASRVDLQNNDQSDSRTISYFFVTVGSSNCSGLVTSTTNSNISSIHYNTGAVNTIYSSYLLLASRLTFNLDLISTTNCSVMVYVFDSVAAHLQFIYQNDISEAVNTFCLSIFSPNFTIVASKPSYYIIDVQFMDAYPSSISYTVSGTIVYYNISYLLHGNNIVPGILPVYTITWTGGIVAKTKSHYLCVLAYVNSLQTDAYDPGTFVQINYTATRRYLQNSLSVFLLMIFLLSGVVLIFLLLCYVYNRCILQNLFSGV